ncbi:MAG TPA: hypothetical protein VJK90_13375 [Acetobacteraceae bacterium]|nr:hypothetical protein [Acetobacteraceae bacterium]
MRTIGLLQRMRRVLWSRRLLAAALTATLAAGVLPQVGRALNQHTEETAASDSVYYTALLSGRDADAALRKAHYLTGTMMQEFRMTRAEAAAYVARSMVWRNGRLCGG